MGEHRWFGEHGAKSTAYEEAANVPMFVRGPGVRAGSNRSALVLNNDFAPTFARIAGLTPATYSDGRSLLPLWRGNNTTWRTAVMNERPAKDGNPITPYHASLTGRYTYVGYTSGEKELYDRSNDPYEVASKHNNVDYADTKATMINRLSALQGCARAGCRAAEDGP
jgi:arylsulfatase A-like enzyme